MEMEVDEDGLDEARTEAALGQEDEVEGFRMSGKQPPLLVLTVIALIVGMLD